MFDTTPLSTFDLVAGLLSVPAILVIGAILVRGSTERRVIVAALGAKLFASVAYVVYVIYIYGGGDTLTYHTIGVQNAGNIGAALFSGSWSSVLSYAALTPTQPSTTNIENLSGIIHFFLFNSFLASSFVMAAMAFVGQLLLYRVFVSLYPEMRIRNWWRFGILFYPSLTFWSAGLLKDTVGILGLGCAVWGAYQVLQKPRIQYVAVGILGVYVLMLFRGQVLPPLVIALVAYAVFGRDKSGADRSPQRRLRVIRRLLALFVAVAAFFVISVFDKQYSLTALPQTISSQNTNYATVGVQGTGLTDSTGPVTADASWSGLMKSAPAAVVYTLFRPFPWEARSGPVLIAGLENLLLLALLTRAFLRGAAGSGALRNAIGSPMFIPCLLFVLLFGAGVGFATPNLGSLSRYRIPLIPFVVGLLTIVEYRSLEFRDVLEETSTGTTRSQEDAALRTSA